MKTTFKDFINEFVASPVVTDMNYKYRNNIDLSGWVLYKPKFYKHDKSGVESCSFFITQITNSNGYLKTETFCCMCYVKSLIDQLREQENIFFVATVGKLRHSNKIKNDYTQVVEMQTLMELDTPFIESEAKNND